MTTVEYVLLFKKKRKSELSNQEKLRMVVEHTLSRIKKFGIMGINFRNKLGRYDHASDIVSGLVNFRIMMRTDRMLLEHSGTTLTHSNGIFFHNYAIGLLTFD